MLSGSRSVTSISAIGAVLLTGALATGALTTATLATPALVTAAKAATPPAACSTSHETVYVGATGKLDGQQTLTPVNAVTGKIGRRIKAGSSRGEIAIAPNGRTAYVANSYSDTVTPINLCRGEALKPIKVGKGPDAIAIAPDGR